MSFVFGHVPSPLFANFEARASASVQGYLAHKKLPLCRTLPEAYA